ncbi:MAG: phosphoglycerate dehydrogenase [Lachnospiraceae bacterium]|nr:phosphoglycerate dehydrogenase [Lachnospiraceae bacterium]MDY5648941.1 phosphoglycerate dehydrogenase [Lachnospiraceae bacterium]
MAKYKVLVTARSFGTADSKALELLEANGCEVKKLVAADGPIPEQLKKELPSADAVIAGLEDYDRELIESAKNLKVISRYGVGYDKVDIAAAHDNHIAVTITPGANGDSVADMAMALMLDCARNVTVMDNGIKGRNQVRPQGLEMWEKTLGVVGAGRIGKGVAKRCTGFNMKILCYDQYQDEAFKKECHAEYVDLDTLIRESDFITIHSPLTPETKNMFSTEQFRAMKKEAILVNTARGGIVDEEALYEALKSGEIRAAGLDATVDEPPYDSLLCTLSNCILTPHAGAATKEASSKMSLMAAQNAVDILTGGTCKFEV